MIRVRVRVRVRVGVSEGYYPHVTSVTKVSITVPLILG